MRQLDTITDSMDMNWTNSRRQWKTEGVLQSMGLQRVKHNLATEQQQSGTTEQPELLSGFLGLLEGSHWSKRVKIWFECTTILIEVRVGGRPEGTHQESIYYPVSPPPHPSSFLSSAERYHALKSLMRKPETWGFASLYKAVLPRFH